MEGTSDLSNKNPYSFVTILFFCLSAQRSVMSMLIVPLPNYGNFWEKIWSQKYIHWASKETYHFFRATLTKIHAIKINIWTQIILLNKNIWKTQDFLASKRTKLRLNHERSFFENRRNCSPSELHGGGLFRIFNSYSFNFNGWLRKRRTGSLLWTPSPRGKQFLWFLKIDLLRFHRIYLLFVWSKLLFF